MNYYYLKQSGSHYVSRVRSGDAAAVLTALNPSWSTDDSPFADPGKDFGENDFRLKRLADEINCART